MRGRIALQKHFPPRRAGSAKLHSKPVRFRPAVAGLSECVRVLASLWIFAFINESRADSVQLIARRRLLRSIERSLATSRHKSAQM
jgi:hypothetical protein